MEELMILNRNIKYGDFCIRQKNKSNIDIPSYCIVKSSKKNITNVNVSIMQKLTMIRQNDTRIQESSNNNKILLEYSCPNTNKPQHIGHLRNNLIGESIKRILKRFKDNVVAINLVNDRGVHICKSMLAYKLNPKKYDTNLKGDHLVGKCYVDYHTFQENGVIDGNAAQEMLKKWEEGDEETIKLWKKMNNMVIDGFKKTYETYSISFDLWQYESDLYMQGKRIIKNNKIFKKDDDGSYYVNLEDINIKASKNKEGVLIDKKTVLRADGTSIYITQDIGVMQTRIDKFNPSKIIQIVADEQNYYFNVLFGITKLMHGDSCPETKHLSYGMIRLVDGVIKSRIGRTVDIDTLYVDVKKMVRDQYAHDWKDSGITQKEQDHRTSLIALSGIKFFILSIKPKKSFVFNPEESIKLQGMTGPYILYTYARIKSIINIVETKLDTDIETDALLSLLETEHENSIVNELFNANILAPKRAREDNDPSIICKALYYLCKATNSFYHSPDHKLHGSGNIKLTKARLILLELVTDSIKMLSGLLSIDLLDSV
jgi:arginyl-tRNA synthetase